MGYSYDDFTKAATGAGLLEKFSQEDLQIAQRAPEFGLSMLKLMQDSAAAATQEGKLLADEAAKQLRTSYGNYQPQISQTLGKLEGYGDFEYKDNDRYRQLLDTLTSPQGVTYDPEQDPVWSAYKKNYLREGDRAAREAITQASVATGGVPSSYAVTAAAQAGNYYADQLSKMIPTLAENDYARKLQALSLMEGDRAFDYQKHLDQFGMLGTKLNALQGQAATEYQKQLDAFEKALTQYQLLGYATPEIAAVLGIPETKRSSGYQGTVPTKDTDVGSAIPNIYTKEQWEAVRQYGGTVGNSYEEYIQIVSDNVAYQNQKQSLTRQGFDTSDMLSYGAWRTKKAAGDPNNIYGNTYNEYLNFYRSAVKEGF